MRTFTQEELNAMFTKARVATLEAIVGEEQAAEIIKRLYAGLGSKSKERGIAVGYKAKASDTPNVDLALDLLEAAKPLLLDNKIVKELVTLLGADTALSVLNVLNGKKPPAQPAGNDVKPADEATPAGKSLGSSVVAQMAGTAVKGKSMVEVWAEEAKAIERQSKNFSGKSIVERIMSGDAI